MRYVIDHDLHIHSHISPCCEDREQTPAVIHAYGEANGFPLLCLTDHMWDPETPGAAKHPRKLSYEQIREALPLPQSEKTRFLFGCETDLDKNGIIGASPEAINAMDFVIIATTHMSVTMEGFTCEGTEDAAERAKLWCSRFEAVLDLDLPFHKIGIAHLTCYLIYFKHGERHLEVLRLIPDEEYRRLFKKAAERGIGIELNFPSLNMSGEELELNLKPFRIAKEEGCKFYFGSDAHGPADLAYAKENFENIIDLLDLEESDKFPFVVQNR